MGKNAPSHWLSIQKNLGLAANTILAYQRALEDYATFCVDQKLDIFTATREHVALYIHNLSIRPVRTFNTIISRGLSNATMHQRLTAIRLYYDFLIEEGVRDTNPVGRGHRNGRIHSGYSNKKGIIPKYHTLPWIPNDEQWRSILNVTKHECIRNRLMLAMAYDAGLRREELCLLATSDIDPAHRLIHIRAETTKGRRARVVPYSLPTSTLLATYLKHRRTLTKDRGALFLSESPRNYTKPITLWTWSKVVREIAKKANILKFSTHTLRHLCLTDLARAGWELHEISTFAGHRNIDTTLLYIHLSGRELAEKLARASSSHLQRLTEIAETLL